MTARLVLFTSILAALGARGSAPAPVPASELTPAPAAASYVATYGSCRYVAHFSDGDTYCPAGNAGATASTRDCEDLPCWVWTNCQLVESCSTDECSTDDVLQHCEFALQTDVEKGPGFGQCADCKCGQIQSRYLRPGVRGAGPDIARCSSHSASGFSVFSLGSTGGTITAKSTALVGCDPLVQQSTLLKIEVGCVLSLAGGAIPVYSMATVHGLCQVTVTCGPCQDGGD